MAPFLRFPQEAAIIGRLVSGYGEIEYIYANCLVLALSSQNVAMRTYFGVKSESTRLDIAKNLMQDAYAEVGLKDRFEAVHSQVKYCRTIRNTFAHCHWESHIAHGLFYVNLETTAGRREGNFNLSHEYKHVDVYLLGKLEAFAWNTIERMQWLIGAYRLASGKSWDNPWKWPRGFRPPNLHNPPEEHPSPWSSDIDTPL
jgi:hypothetical protein